MHTTRKATNPMETKPTTVAVDSKPATKRLKPYLIAVAVRSESGGPPTVREIKIDARSKKHAEALATYLVSLLDAARVQSITTEYKRDPLGSGSVLRIGPARRSKKANGHVWTPREIGELLATHGSINNLKGGDHQLSLIEVGA